MNKGKRAHPIIVIFKVGLSWRVERMVASSESCLGPTLGYSNFWRLGRTVVASQMRRFSSPTVSSAHTLTVYSLPFHLTHSVISSQLSPPEDDADAMAAYYRRLPCFLLSFCFRRSPRSFPVSTQSPQESISSMSPTSTLFHFTVLFFFEVGALPFI